MDIRVFVSPKPYEQRGRMNASEFRRAMSEEFGSAYAGVLLRDHWLPQINATGQEALDSGVTPREVWRAVCEEFAIPEARRYGRGLLDPDGDPPPSATRR